MSKAEDMIILRKARHINGEVLYLFIYRDQPDLKRIKFKEENDNGGNRAI